MLDSDAVTALRRFGFGPRPGDWREIADDPRGYVEAQIGRDTSAAGFFEGLPGSAQRLRDLGDVIAETKDAKKEAAEADMVFKPDGMDGPTPPAYAVGAWREEAAARFNAAAYSDDGLTERLVSFWSNHFCVSALRNGGARATAGAYEREAIRPFVYGRFVDMLAAVAMHPTMLLYLDNNTNIGPNSKAGTRKGAGYNENLAREILELHTLGVDGGYTQRDVTSFAKVLTGWTVRAYGMPDGGEFVFNPRAHEPGTFTVLGERYGQEGRKKGVRVLRDLAAHPATARHVTGKFVRHFVGDKPPPGLLKACEKTFRDTGGDLAALTATLVGADSAWAAPPAKVLPPFDMLVATTRAAGIEPPLDPLMRALDQLGQRPWTPRSPEGYPDGDSDWAAPDALITRLDILTLMVRRFTTDVTTDIAALADDLYGPVLGEATLTAIRRAESREQAMTLLLMSPELQRR